MRGIKFGVTVAALALLSGCGGGDSAEAAVEQGQRGAARIAAVEVAPVERGAIAREVTVSGVVEPIRTIAVNSQLSGALLAVMVEEGDVVRAGDVLARLDDRELRAQIAAAEASHQVAEAAYERARQLRDRNVITLPEYERDRNALAAAQAQLDQLRTRLDYSVINAPINGVITAKRVETGDVVAPQTQLFTVADVSTLVTRVGVSELDVVQLSPGQPVAIALDAFPGYEFRGQIRRIFPTADPGTRLVPVEVALENEEPRVARPGFLARATFALGAREGVLMVPASAVVSGTGGSAVFVVDNDRAMRQSVTTGLTSQGRVEVISGLAEDDVVVTAGNNTLRDGAEIRIVAAAGVPVQGPADTSLATGETET